MTIAKIKKIFKSEKPLIGVIHLPALPGYEVSPGMETIISKALADLKTLEKAEFNGVLVENDGDHPPHIGASKQVTKQFGKVMEIVIQKAHVPVGLEILYDMPGTVKLAAKVKAQFVRLDVFVDSGITRYGPTVFAEPKKIVEIKKKLYPELLLFTDVQVKHLAMLDKSKSLETSIKSAVASGSDGVIVTGIWTGKEPTSKDCITAKKNAGDIPVFIGSGLSSKNADKFLSILDGGIVASSIKKGEYIDLKKAKELVSVVKKMEGNI